MAKREPEFRQLVAWDRASRRAQAAETGNHCEEGAVVVLQRSDLDEGPALGLEVGNESSASTRETLE